MKKNILNKSVFFIAVILSVAGCKAKKEVVLPKVVTVSAEKSDYIKRDKLVAIKNNLAVFSTLSIKAKADLSIGNISNDVNMNIRIRNNEAIWVSVTAIAGLEVARALITPDSVKILNRMENVYVKKPFSYIYEFTNEQINFATLQSILIGNTISEFITDSSELNILGNQVNLKSVIGLLMYSVHINEQNKVIQTNLNDKDTGQVLTVNYSNFIAVSQQQVPHSVTMISQAKNKNIRLDLKFAKVEMGEAIDLPFRVPDRFLIKN